MDGCFSRTKVPNTIIYEIYRQYPFINDKTINQNIIEESFLNFCSTGVTEGEYHYFMGIGDKRKCIKCGATIEEIRKTTDYQNVKVGCKTNNPTSHCTNCSYKELAPLLTQINN